MRLMDRDRRDLWVSRPERREVIGSDGLGTLEFVDSLSTPVRIRANFGETVQVNSGGSQGFAEQMPYGYQPTSNASIVLDEDPFGFEEGCVVWTKEPEVKDGVPATRGAYVVRRITETLHFTIIGLSRKEGA